MTNYKFFINGANYHVLALVYILPCLWAFCSMLRIVFKHMKNINQVLFYIKGQTLLILGLMNALRVIFDFTAMFYIDAAGYTVYSPVTYFLML